MTFHGHSLCCVSTTPSPVPLWSIYTLLPPDGSVRDSNRGLRGLPSVKKLGVGDSIVIP